MITDFQIGDEVELTQGAIRLGLAGRNRSTRGVVTDLGKRTIWVRREGWKKAVNYAPELWRKRPTLSQGELDACKTK